MRGVFLDLETNGLDPFQHSVLEIALSIVDMRSLRSFYTYSTFVRTSEKQFILASDPQALSVNQILLSDVIEAKEIDDIKDDLVEIFLSYEIEKQNAIFICQNPSFDRMFFDSLFPVELQKDLNLPYHWLDLASMYWMKIAHPRMIEHGKASSLSKDNIAIFLGLKPEEKPHRALNGVNHLIECYKKLVEFTYI